MHFKTALIPQSLVNLMVSKKPFWYCRDADVIRLVVDNLNIHNPAALYEVFEPQEARRIIRKLEFHYTPKHASWLNQVEIELSVLSRQCLERRIGDCPKGSGLRPIASY